MTPDEDKLDALANVLRAIAGEAEAGPHSAMPRSSEAGTAPDRASSQVWSPRLDVALLDILTAPSFDERVALQRLVADAVQD